LGIGDWAIPNPPSPIPTLKQTIKTKLTLNKNKQTNLNKQKERNK